MVLLLGLLLTAFIASVFMACLRLIDIRENRGWLWFFLIAGATCILFRPDEELEAGEDAGGYFNAALSYARHQRLRFVDPALAEAPPAERAVFRYGHAGFLTTKDACLWAEDPRMDKVGPWFFPAYPLLMSVPAALGFPYGAFWVAPVLALLIAALLAGLAQWLTGLRVGAVAAFILYLLHPAVIWNARCARAEWPASFLVLAGLVLWMAPLIPGKPASRTTGLLAGLSLTAAMLFHITAAYVVIPATLASLWLTRRTSFWTGWWCGFSAGVGLFLAQIVWLTDPYWMKQTWADPGRRLFLLSACGSVLAMVVALRFFGKRGVASGRIPWVPSRAAVGGGISILFVLLALLSIPMRTEQGHIPGLPDWTVSYMSLTDFEGVMKLSSRLWFLSALLGTVVLCVRRGGPGRLGRRLFFMLAPASMTIGWVNNYMFETRRMATFLVPLLVLSLSALLAVIREKFGCWLNKRRLRNALWAGVAPDLLMCLLTTGLLLTTIRGRWPLYATWNNRGTYDFYKKLSDRAREAGDFLFAEYTQTAAPIERLADRPLLPLAWPYRSDADYRVAERIMAGLVKAHPARRHLLITPFTGAALPGLSLEPLFSETLQTRRLERLKRAVPTAVRERTLTLHVWRVLGGGTVATNAPYVRMMDGGRLGLSGAANFMPSRNIEIQGTPASAGQPSRVGLAFPREISGPVTLALVFAVPAGVAPALLSVDPVEGIASSVRRYSIGPGWEVLEWEREAPDERYSEYKIQTSEQVYLTDAFCIRSVNEPAARLQVDAPRESFFIEKTDSQWLKADAALVLPVRRTSSRVWVLAAHGREGEPVVECEIGLSGVGADKQRCRIEAGWNWSVFTLPGVGEAPGVFRWHDLVTRPAWNPEKPGFPEDLGLRIQRVCVVL